MTATQILKGYAALATVVVPAIISPMTIDDPMTTPCSRAPLRRKSDLVVSGDRHLLKLEQHKGVPIVTPTLAVERLGL